MALGLSTEQKERLLAARTYLLAQMMEIISERTAIINMLQVRRRPLRLQPGALPPDCSSLQPAGHRTIRGSRRRSPWLQVQDLG